MSMPDHNDDPVAAAGGKVASYLSLATVAAEAIAQLAAARARERAGTDERTAAALRAQRGGGAFVGGGAFPGPGRRELGDRLGGHRGQAQVGGDLPAGGRDRVVVVVGHAHSPLRPSRGCATGAAGAGERSVGPHPPLPAGGSPAGSSSAHHPSGAGTVGSGGPALCRSTVHCANGPPLPTVPAPEGWWAE